MKKRQKTVEVLEEHHVVNDPAAVYAIPVSSISNRIWRLLDEEPKARSLQHETDFIQLIRKGVSKKSLDHLILQIGYTINDIASVLHVSDRNLRRYEPKELLNVEQSERLVEIARLYARGEEVFGSIQAFNQWMDTEILALGNQTPRSFLDTSLGIQLLLNELGRIEHGVFA